MSEARSPAPARVAVAAAISTAVLTLGAAGPATEATQAAPARGALTLAPGGDVGEVVRVVAIAPARRGRANVELPVAALDPRRPVRVKLRGAVTLKAGRRSVRLRDLRASVRASGLSLSARIGGKRRALLVSGRPGRRLTVKPGRARLARVPVKLTRGGVRALRAALRLDRLAGRSFGAVALDAAVARPKPAPPAGGSPARPPAPPAGPPAGPPPEPGPYAFCPTAAGSGPGTPGGQPPAPAAAPALGAPLAIGSGKVDWGFRASFRDYVANGDGDPAISTQGGAAVNPDGSFAFPVGGGQLEAGAAPRAVVDGAGAAVFCFPAHFFRIAMLDPTVTIDGAQSRLTVDIDSELFATRYGPWRADVAALDVADVEPEYGNDGQSVVWRDVPAALTAAGASAFAGFYSAGTVLDPLTVRAGDELAQPETRVASRVDAVHDPAQPIGDSDSDGVAVSANGRYVAFDSYAANLIPGDTFDTRDVFVRDLLTRRTTRVSVDSAGQPGTGSEPASRSPQISADGRYVAFVSGASLVAADVNDTPDVYVRDTVELTTTLVSVATDAAAAGGVSGPLSISADGRRVAFFSSSDGLAAGDGDGVLDAFVRDLDTATTTRVSVSDDEVESTVAVRAEGGISADGEHVVFGSPDDTLVAGDGNGRRDVFVRDLVDATTTLVSLGDDESQATAHVELGSTAGTKISADGDLVVFYSSSATLVAGDGNGVRDCFVRDVAAQTTRRLNVSASGAESATACGTNPTISADGSTVAFSSVAADLVTGDGNGVFDVFVRAVGDAASIQRASVSTGGLEENGPDGASGTISLGGSGRHIGLESAGSSLTGSNEGRYQVLVRELP